MRTASDHLTNLQLSQALVDSWSVTVVYEDTGGRERAQSLCQHLVDGFRTEIDFAFNWWRFRYLGDPDIAQAAAQAAANADILLFSANSNDDLPEEVRNWTDLWIPLRIPGEGVLLVLTEDAEGVTLSSSPLFRTLRNLARKASMDCLPHIGEEPWTVSTDAIRGMQDRAGQTSRLLDDMLRRTPPYPIPPTHWGINE